MGDFPNITVVDENDVNVRFVTFAEAAEQKLIKRVSRVLLQNKHGEFLLQRRSSNVANPLLLCESASGHVDEGHTYEEAAYKELEEELGISGIQLSLVTKPFHTPLRYNAVYRGVIPGRTRLIINQHEVIETLWVSRDRLDEWIAEDSSKFLGPFVATWEYLRRHDHF